MSLTLQKIEELAPDQASLNAAQKLLKPAKWPVMETAAGLIWAECQGSGSTPYRVAASLEDYGYKCSCPSRKFPCKHALALMWFYVQDANQFASGSEPEWVKDWLSRRRPKAAAGKPAVADKGGHEAPSLRAARNAPEEDPKDEKAKARAAAQRERNRKAREESILAGLEELDLWITDQLDRGLAGFQPLAQEQCRIAAQRLTDAKAPGLARRLDELPAQLFALPESKRSDFLIAELGQLHLLAEAYRRQAQLPSALRADVRELVGWTLQRDDLLQDGSAVRTEGKWLVAAVRSEVQADRMRRFETWLLRKNGAAEEPQTAVLIDFLPVATGASSAAFSAGEAIDAALVFYPSAAPLRALVAQRRGPAAEDDPWPTVEDSLQDGLAALDRRRADLPFRRLWPLAARDLLLRETGAQELWLTDAAGEAGLPVHPRLAEQAAPLADCGAFEALVLWDGRFAEPLMAQTALGRWVGA